MQRRDLNAHDAPPPVAAYTQAIEVSGAHRTLYISGQVGVGDRRHHTRGRRWDSDP